jgi:hypothetical protein
VVTDNSLSDVADESIPYVVRLYSRLMAALISVSDRWQITRCAGTNRLLG